MSTITDLFAGVAVSDLDVSIDWYTRFFERHPDHRVGGDRETLAVREPNRASTPRRSSSQ